MNGKMILAGASFVGLIGAGPLEGFFKENPAETVSPALPGDIERCLIENVAAAPFVYRQPDRPNVVTLVWTHQFQKPSNPVARIEISQEGDKSRVRAWRDGKKIVAQFPACF